MSSMGVGHELYHYRTSGGAEIDLVLEGDFGLIPVEIKQTQAVRLSGLRAMKDFISEHGCRYGVAINNDERARLYDDNILGLPFACLTA